ADLDALARALSQPARPLVAIVGGAKVSSKLRLLRTLAANVDTLIVGGRIGRSLAEPELVAEARAILDAFPGKIPLPVDVACAKRFAAGEVASIKTVDAVADDDLILDIGPRTVAMLL